MLQTLQFWKRKYLTKKRAEVIFAVVDGKEIGFAFIFPQLLNILRQIRSLS